MLRPLIVSFARDVQVPFDAIKIMHEASAGSYCEFDSEFLVVSSWSAAEVQARLSLVARKAMPRVRHFDITERMRMHLTAKQTLLLHDAMELAATIGGSELASRSLNAGASNAEPFGRTARSSSQRPHAPGSGSTPTHRLALAELRSRSCLFAEGLT